MAQIVGRIALSHGPQLLILPNQWDCLPKGREPLPAERDELAPHLTPETQHAYYDRCPDAMGTLAAKIDAWQPDSTIIIGSDKHESIQDDNTPPTCIFMGGKVDASNGNSEGFGLVSTATLS